MGFQNLCSKNKNPCIRTEIEETLRAILETLFIYVWRSPVLRLLSPHYQYSTVMSDPTNWLRDKNQMIMNIEKSETWLLASPDDIIA